MMTNIQEIIKKITATRFYKMFFSKICFAIILISFFLILINREPNLIRPIGLLIQFQPHLSLPIIGLLLFLFMRIEKKHLSIFLSSFLILSLFSLSLAGIWANTQTENYMIAGLLPRSDASFQYAGALKLLDFGELNGTTSRRPFFGEFLAILLGLTQRNLQFTIAIIVFLASISALFSTFETRNFTNSISTVLFLILIFLFYSKFVGLTMTENLGYIFGLLSFTMFMKALRLYKDDKTKSMYFYIFGIFIFSLGQNARPGAIFTIPLFVCFSAWLWKDNNKISWKIVFFTFLAALLPFLISQIHFMINGLQSTFPMSNMGYGLYGFVKGGEGWNRILYDYPELKNMPTKDLNSQMFKYIFMEIKNNPVNIIEGFKYQLSSLFTIKGENSLFSFVQIDKPLLNSMISYFIYFLSVLGLIRVIFKKNKQLAIFFLLIIIGFFISLPFSPAYQTQYMRVYAVSIPFLCFFPSYGLDFLFSNTIGKKIFIEKSILFDLKSEIFAMLFSFFIIIAPLFINLLSLSKPDIDKKCPQKLISSVVFYNPNSSINIVKDDSLILNWVPNIHQSKFRLKAHNICCEDNIKFFESLSAPVTLFTSLEYFYGNIKYFVIADTDSLPKNKGWIQLCGTVKDIYGNPSAYGFFYPEMVYSID
jgi:hypothetical protein